MEVLRSSHSLPASSMAVPMDVFCKGRSNAISNIWREGRRELRKEERKKRHKKRKMSKGTGLIFLKLIN